MHEKYEVFSFSEEVNERLYFLREQREQIEKMWGTFPAGNLLVAPGKTENSFRYYNRKSPQDKMGEYIGKDAEKLKKELAMKKYCSVAHKKITNEIKQLEKIQGMNLADSLVETYTNLSIGVRKLIDVKVVDDETFIKMWTSIPYEGLGFSEDDDTEYYSELNERMRSKSEVLIANHLHHSGIYYKYECPVIRKNGEKLYPDFTILDVKRRRVVYWEHLGRMGDMSYISKNIWKLDEYRKIGIYPGINLYFTFESDIFPMGTNDPIKVIDAIQS